MSVDAEVIVAGAGPAGAAAARTLAAAGVDTLVVDRTDFPRNKPCGGGITSRALVRFPWLDRALRDGEVDVHTIGRLHLEGPGGATLKLERRDPCVLLVRRVEFDHALIRAAIGARARFLPRFEITQVGTSESDVVTLQSRDGRTLRARWVIAADGVHSVIGKRTGLNPRWGRRSLAIDMMEETPVATLAADRPDVLWVAYAYENLDGYAYVFPKMHHVNVGIGCLLSHFDESVSEPPYALQERFVRLLVERGVLSGTSDRRCFTPFLIPVGGPLPNASCGRILFAGDAGGFVNAITAEGIYYAMASGDVAASVLVRARGHDDPVRVRHDYDRAWRAEMGTELADAVRLQRYLFASHDRVARVIRGAATASGLANMILDYVDGRLSYGALRRRVMLRFPWTVLRLARQTLGLGSRAAS